MKTSNYLIGFVALTSLTLVGCSDNDFLGTDNGQEVAKQGNGEITFVAGNAKTTRAGEFVGATAAEKLGGMFVVEGTKGSEQENSPSTDVVFDNYLVGYTANSAGRTETNTNNWEYVGKEAGIADRMTAATWGTLHGDGAAKAQTVKYWDYSTAQYDFIAWSTGLREAVTDAAVAGTKVKVTRINTGTTLSSNGFKLTAASAADLMQCYYTDINTVLKTNYGAPVTLTFRNMAAKARIALYETVPGYSIKDVKFYTSDANPTAPTDLGEGTTTAATLFTMGSDVLPQSGEVTVFYPHIGTEHRDAPQTTDYNKASVTVGEVTGGATSTTQGFGTLTAQYGAEESHEAEGNIYLGRSLPNATYAGSSADNFYTAVIPNSTGKALTLRVDYTLVSTDGSGEEIKVYGAKAVVPATYTVWQPNYAYTYVFKISDNTNGWTSTDKSDPAGLYPITFDAVVLDPIVATNEQTTITTVAMPSITTYQKDHAASNNEYVAGEIYVQVMNGSTLATDLHTKSSLYSLSEAASEAEVMDALNLQASEAGGAAYITGRNGLKLTSVALTYNEADPTDKLYIPGEDGNNIIVDKGKAAKFTATADTYYAYVYQVADAADDNVIYPVVLTAEPDDWSTTDNVYYTDAACTSHADTAYADGTYYRKYTNLNKTLGVKVIKVMP